MKYDKGASEEIDATDLKHCEQLIQELERSVSRHLIFTCHNDKRVNNNITQN